MNNDRTEELRQLRAARDGRFLSNEHGRYVIPDEPRPDRKTRERLLNRQLITWTWAPARGMKLTSEGEAALRRMESEEAA